MVEIRLALGIGINDDASYAALRALEDLTPTILRDAIDEVCGEEA